jgi:hypothetical protein
MLTINPATQALAAGRLGPHAQIERGIGEQCDHLTLLWVTRQLIAAPAHKPALWRCARQRAHIQPMLGHQCCIAGCRQQLIVENLVRRSKLVPATRQAAKYGCRSGQQF